VREGVRPALRRGRPISVPVRARPDELVAVFAFDFRQRRVDRSREARVVELDREVVAVGLGGALLPGGAELDIAGVDAEVRALVGRVSTPAMRALTLRARVRIEPVKPFSVVVKVPMVAIVLFPFRSIGPRPSRPRWLSQRPGTIGPHLKRGRNEMEGGRKELC